MEACRGPVPSSPLACLLPGLGLLPPPPGLSAGWAKSVNQLHSPVAGLARLKEPAPYTLRPGGSESADSKYLAWSTLAFGPTLRREEDPPAAISTRPDDGWQAASAAGGGSRIAGHEALTSSGRAQSAAGRPGLAALLTQVYQAIGQPGGLLPSADGVVTPACLSSSPVRRAVLTEGTRLPETVAPLPPQRQCPGDDLSLTSRGADLHTAISLLHSALCLAALSTAPPASASSSASSSSPTPNYSSVRLPTETLLTSTRLAVLCQEPTDCLEVQPSGGWKRARISDGGTAALMASSHLSKWAVGTPGPMRPSGKRRFRDESMDSVNRREAGLDTTLPPLLSRPGLMGCLSQEGCKASEDEAGETKERDEEAVNKSRRAARPTSDRHFEAPTPQHSTTESMVRALKDKPTSPPAASIASASISSHFEITQEARARLARIENHIGDYVCRLCDRLFEDAFALAQHRCPRILHTEYRCPDCEKVSHSNSLLTLLALK
ncbi:unnamed protein product [Protopolystoma xenopodis]|uniref:C2H2-type domain-containing protein n=1 Tax=Protopolystoma xenopodis TaxID=117903 RepID=A0A448WZX1_9PLAT|nr:unnamed protein product [Protopolystoma xenopodis]